MFHYIIGHRDHSPKQDRTKNLQYILDWLKKCPLLSTVVIVEIARTKSTWLQEEERKTKRFHHVFIQNDSPYNRSLAFNQGAKHLLRHRCVSSNEDYFIFGDNDVYLDNLTAVLEEVRQGAGEIKAFSPYVKIYDLLPPASNESERKQLRQGTAFAGGIVGIQVEAFRLLGGWMEEFKGWGGEDGAMSHLLSRYIGPQHCRSFPEEAYHLWHPRDEQCAKTHHRLRRFNMLQLQHLKMSDAETLESRLQYRRLQFYIT